MMWPIGDGMNVMNNPERVEAVAWDVVRPDGAVVASRVDAAYADELLREYQWGDCRKANPLYTPAAVAALLRGMVPEWSAGDDPMWNACCEEMLDNIARWEAEGKK